MENKVVPFKTIEGTVYISNSGHLHRHQRGTRTEVPLGLLFNFNQPYLNNQDENNPIKNIGDLRNFATEHGGKVLNIRPRHWLRKKDDGLYRIHRHRTHRSRDIEAPEQIGNNAYILTGDTAQQVEGFWSILSGQKPKKTKTKKTSAVPSTEAIKATPKKKSVASKVVSKVKDLVTSPKKKTTKKATDSTKKSSATDKPTKSITKNSAAAKKETKPKASVKTTEKSVKKTVTPAKAKSKTPTQKKETTPKTVTKTPAKKKVSASK